MLRNRYIAGSLAVLAVIVLAGILTNRQAAVQQNDRHLAAERTQDRQQALQERRLKTEAVRRDREATALLCAEACSADLARLLKQAGRDNESAAAAAGTDAVLRSNPHMRAIVTTDASGRRIVRGSVPARAASRLREAETAAAAGRPFYSGLFELDGERYMTVGVPGPSGTGAAALVHQGVLKSVERDQQRSMRLTSYPMEGRYRTESTETGTLRETTVRSGEDNQRVSHYHIDEVVVRFHGDPDRRTLDRMSRDTGAISVRKLGYTYVFRSTRMNAKQMMAYFERTWKPVYTEPHYLYLTNAQTSAPYAPPETAGFSPIVPNDILYSRYQWNLPSIETERGWNLGRGSEAVVVAVVDTGVQRDHPDLQGKLVEGLNIVKPGSPPEDDVGHGTHVAGIVAANVNNGQGVAGVSWFNRIMPVKVLDETGAGNTYNVAEGIIWATDHGAKVINLSLGNYASAEFLHDAIRYAYDRDVVLIAASGNDNTDRPGYPAAYPEVFAIGATDEGHGRASFSNFGDYVDAAAPGETIASTYMGSQYAALSGTSMASPHAAALAALIRSVSPELTNRDVMAIMRTTARDLGPKGRDDQFGSGQIDVVRALNAAVQSSVSLQSFPERMARRLELIRQRYAGGTQSK